PRPSVLSLSDGARDRLLPTTSPRGAKEAPSAARTEYTLPRTERLAMPAAAVPVSSDGLHIVLVEDMVEVGTIIQRLGRKSGLNITWFTTAEEAWEFLQSNRPDFLIFD